MKIISRPRLLSLIAQRFRTNPIVMLLGPRQCGKTTLARQYAVSTERASFFDLESPADAQRLSQPMIALEPLRGLVVIDEAQLSPALFPVLRVLVDRRPSPAKFFLLGSASPELASNVAESLAGRVALLPMAGFDLNELPAKSMRPLWLRGGFPRSFLAPSDAASRQWRDDLIQTFLERDLRRLGVHVAPPTMRRFWTMAAHTHGQIWNASEVGRSLGEAHTTIKRHLDALSGAYVIRQLPPWFENIGKRQVKSPKVFVRDSGLLHALLGIESLAALAAHPKLGASWEGFALEQVLRITGDRDAYFWNTQGVAELDLLMFIQGQRIGFEFKYADAPTMTKSLTIAHRDLKLDRSLIIYPGTTSYRLGESIEVVAIDALTERLTALISPRVRRKVRLR
ncbi:MAG: ATP-binding protein [Gammaproteobacteria bacterium]|nr:ATP-binding protein [Gammaproteobacteria bacterium]